MPALFLSFNQNPAKKNKLRKVPSLSSSNNSLRPKVKREELKIHEILLCSHIDSFIYSYYTFLLSEEYKTYKIIFPTFQSLIES